MGSKNPRQLKIKRVFVLHIPALVLVLQSPSQELTPVPTHIRGHAPYFLFVVHGVLRPIEPAPDIPIPIDLLLGQQIHPERMLSCGSRSVRCSLEGEQRENSQAQSPAIRFSTVDF